MIIRRSTPMGHPELDSGSEASPGMSVLGFLVTARKDRVFCFPPDAGSESGVTGGGLLAIDI